MTTTNEAFKALMPDSVGFRTRSEIQGHYPWTYSDARRRLCDRPACEYEDLYTAEQMRQMFDAATERAAKLCDAQASMCEASPVAESACEECAAAIRAGGEQT